MLSLFYATIGLEAGLFEIYRVGLPLLTLISTALILHVSVVMFGSILWNKLIYKLERSSDRCGDSSSNSVGSFKYSRYLVDIDTAVVAR